MDDMPPRPVSQVIAAVRDFANDLVVWAGSVVRHALVVFGGAVVTFALFATEHQRGEAYSWRAAEYIIGATFVLALFLSWRESYRNWLNESEGALPKLYGYFKFIGKGAPLDDHGTPLFLAYVEIRNDGFRSVVKDFCPAVAINGREHLGRLAKTSKKVRMTLSAGNVAVFREKDAIYNATKTPIEPGDARSGHLYFYFSRAAGDFDKHLVRLYFRDYRNRVFVTEPIDPNETVDVKDLPNLAGMFSLEQHRASEDTEPENGVNG